LLATPGEFKRIAASVRAEDLGAEATTYVTPVEDTFVGAV